MTSSSANSPSSALPRILAAVLLLGAGFALGTFLRPGPVRASSAARAGLLPAHHSGAIEQQIAELRIAVLERVGLKEQAGLLAAPAPAPIAERHSAAPAPQSLAPDLAERLAAIEERLTVIERNSRLLLARRSGSIAPKLRIPPGMPVRDFLQAIEDMDNDESTRLHELWTGDQLLQAYGQPDRIEERDNYTEWIYTLGPDEQLDFHLTGGLVTLAH